MMFKNYLLCFSILLTISHSFNLPKTSKKTILNTIKYKISMISYDNKDDSKANSARILKEIYNVREDKSIDPLSKFTFDDIITPPNVDNKSITKILFTQGFLLGLSVAIGYFFHILNPLQLSGSFSFDTNSMLFASKIGLGLIVFGFILDSLPSDNFKAIARDTRIFCLRVLGRSTSPLQAASFAFLLAATAGFCEEIAFRGYIYTAFDHSFGTIVAFIISSLLFGLAHYPIFGSSTILETIFGLVFAYSYYISGYNLAVPIAIHTLYDFGTIYFTWFRASENFKQRLNDSGELIINYPKDTPLSGQMDMIAKQAFKILDSDKDGSIDETEFLSGLHLFGTGTMPIKTTDIIEERKLFRELDKNKDGKISYEEFTAFFRDIMNRWLTMV